MPKPSGTWIAQLIITLLGIMLIASQSRRAGQAPAADPGNAEATLAHLPPG